jgi:vacuolar protein sorting-associated protein 13A/C
MNQILHQLVCDVTVINKVKVITLRSTMRVINATNVPIEICLSSKRGADITEKPKFNVPAGESFSVPIVSTVTDHVFWRPFGFGYDWSSQGVNWKDIHKETLICLLTCNSFDNGTPNFRFQLNSTLHSKDRYVYFY